MRFANRVNRISVSPTAAVLAEAERLKAQGVDVVDFGPGEPDFPTPEHIKQAAIEALKQQPHQVHGDRRESCRCARRSASGIAEQLGSSYEPANASSPSAASTPSTTP